MIKAAAHLDKETKVGKHGEATILQLLHTQLREGVWVISEAKGVEWATCSTSHTEQTVRTLTERGNSTVSHQLCVFKQKGTGDAPDSKCKHLDRTFIK